MVGRKMSIKAIETAMKTDKKVFLLMQKKAEKEDPKLSDLYRVGTICEVLQILKIPDGTIKVLVEGIKKAKVKALYEQDDHYRAKVVIPEIINPSDESLNVEGQIRNLTQLFEEYIKFSPGFIWMCA